MHFTIIVFKSLRIIYIIRHLTYLQELNIAIFRGFLGKRD